MRLRKLISGVSAFAMAVSSFAGLTITANANPGDKAEVYSGTPEWTALGGSAETVTNYDGLDTSNSMVASAHKHDGGSGDRRAYNYFTNTTPTDGQNVEIELYLNIAGANQNASHFYLMSTDHKSNSDPTSGIILDFTYTSYIGAYTVNGTPITNVATNTDTKYQPTTNSKYAATGLIKYDIVLNYGAKKADITVYGTTEQTYSVNFADNTVTDFKGFYSTLGRALAGCSIYDVHVSTVEKEVVTYHTVEFDVNGAKSQQSIASGSRVESVPDTDRTGYIFKGWAMNGNHETLLSTDEVSALEITEDKTFEAVYERDAKYIEPIASAVIVGADSMTFGPDPDTPENNEYKVVLTGEIGTDITAETLDERVDDFNIVWDIDGFATQNDQSGQYCDSYGQFLTNNSDSTSTIFALKNVPMNFYGKMTATVTYNGDTIVASKYVTALGDKTMPLNRVLPEAGYPTDFNKYPDALIGYTAAMSENNNNQSGSDAILGNLFVAGSDAGREAKLSSDETGKFIRITKTTTGKSDMLTHTLNLNSQQVIVSQKVRFNSAGAAITFTRGYPIWSNAASYSSQLSFEFNGTNANINGATLLDSTDAAAAIQTGKWYNVVISLDPTIYKAWAKIFSEDGELVGEVSNVAFSSEAIPAYYSIGIGNSSTGTIDLAGYEICYPVADTDTFKIEATQDTLSIPNGDTADLSASLKTAEGYDITGVATWTVLEDDMKEGVIVTPDESDSHKAKVTLADGASAGEATVQVSIGGYTKTVVLNITSSAESVKFTKSSTSVSIPLDDNTITAEYAAIVVSGDGTDLGRSTTLAVYDKTNTSEYTLPAGITFDASTGILTVTKDAPAVTFAIRATGKNSDGGDISKSVKVTVHGLSFDFGTGTDEDLVEGYTAVAPDTSYTASRGYGISKGSVTVGGAASTENANSDYVEGAMTFNANVQKGKNYTIEITYQGELRTGYVNSDLAGYPVDLKDNYGAANGMKGLTTKTYTIAVPVDTLDLIVSDYTEDGTTYPAQVASITITKNADKPAKAKPDIHHVGDSTAANTGSWAYHIDHNRSSFPELDELATFYNNGAGGRNLCTYYTQGKLGSVLSSIEPGDIVMFGNNGTNGLGSYFEDDVNYYLDAAEAMGAKIIINSYTPHGAVKEFASGYNRETHIFDSWRRDSGDPTTRKIAEERETTDPNYLGFVEIGKNADAAFNAYVADYATNNYADENAAADAIIACFSDHNHYSNDSLARNLMLEGYSNVEGIIGQLVNILSAEPVKTHTVTFTGDNATVTVDGKTVTSTTVKEGSSVKFTVTAAEGYEVKEVKAGEDVLEADNGVYTLTDVTADTTVTITTEKVVVPESWIKYEATYENGVLKNVEITHNAEPTSVTNDETHKTFFWNDKMKPWTAE